MSHTTDPKDPDLTYGVDDKEVPQAKTYLILSEEERAKGFVQPVRTSYVHVGIKPKYPLSDLTEQQRKDWCDSNYVKFEKYPDSSSGVTGRLWTQEQLDNKGCGAVTTMSIPIAETYARDPKFYSSTYCVGCRRHLPVGEFFWVGEPNRTVGSTE